MSTYSTFGTFTLARMGIYVSQQALNVTGNNIANINTEGYTRQELDQSSMNFGAADRYITKYSIRQNGGVLANGVNQLRDQYLDIRYRNESTRVGEMEAKLSGLEQLSDIFDEVAKGEDGEGVLEARFNDFIQQLENLSQPGNIGSDSADSLVRGAAEQIATQFNEYARKLETLTETLTAEFRDNVTGVNTTLTKIRDLNESIRTAETFGDTALTQRDERNLLIDELSKQIGINVTYEAERLDDGRQIDKLVITTSGEPERTLVDGIYSAELSLTAEKNGAGDPVFDLSITQLKDSNGRPDTAVRNPMEDMVTELTTVAGLTGAMTFDENTAAKIAEQLNGNYAYTTGADGAQYAFKAVPESDASDAKWVVSRYRSGDENQSVVDYAVVGTEPRTLIGDTELTGGLQAMRELLTEEGEYADAEDLVRDPNAGSKRGIPYYQKALDKLANEFAKQINAANTLDDYVIYQSSGVRTNGYKTNADGTAYVDENGNDTTDPTKFVVKYVDAKGNETDDPNEYTIFVDSKGDPTTDSSKYVIKDEYSYYNGGALFSNDARTDSTGDSGDAENDPPITAANISIAYSWSHGSTRVLRSKQENPASLQQENIAHIITLMTSNQKFEYGTASEGTSYFKGTFQDMLTDSIAGNLAKDQNITKAMLNNYTATADEIYNSRDSVMGVDLNDEAMNMMMFQKAYSAACRLMTTYDGLLDKLINGTAV